MYQIHRSISSNFGHFKEGTKNTLKKVPESVRRGWLAQGLITKLPLIDLPPVEDESELEVSDPVQVEDAPQSYAEELGQKSARTVDDGSPSGETYGSKRKAKRS